MASRNPCWCNRSLKLSPESAAYRVPSVKSKAWSLKWRAKRDSWCAETWRVPWSLPAGISMNFVRPQEAWKRSSSNSPAARRRLRLRKLLRMSRNHEKYLDHLQQRTAELFRISHRLSVVDDVRADLRLLLLECTRLFRDRGHGDAIARPDIPHERQRADHPAAAL